MALSATNTKIANVRVLLELRHTPKIKPGSACDCLFAWGRDTYCKDPGNNMRTRDLRLCETLHPSWNDGRWDRFVLQQPGKKCPVVLRVPRGGSFQTIQGCSSASLRNTKSCSKGQAGVPKSTPRWILPCQWIGGKPAAVFRERWIIWEEYCSCGGDGSRCSVFPRFTGELDGLWHFGQFPWAPHMNMSLTLGSRPKNKKWTKRGSGLRVPCLSQPWKTRSYSGGFLCGE